jgi:hypothetical protein
VDIALKDRAWQMLRRTEGEDVGSLSQSERAELAAVATTNNLNDGYNSRDDFGGLATLFTMDVTSRIERTAQGQGSHRLTRPELYEIAAEQRDVILMNLEASPPDNEELSPDEIRGLVIAVNLDPSRDGCEAEKKIQAAKSERAAQHEAPAEGEDMLQFSHKDLLATIDLLATAGYKKKAQAPVTEHVDKLGLAPAPEAIEAEKKSILDGCPVTPAELPDNDGMPPIIVDPPGIPT